tara:strand:- start:1039 stop:2346 length:1308 start_codon:yes stop_codon:yes gene_type:complete
MAISILAGLGKIAAKSVFGGKKKKKQKRIKKEKVFQRKGSVKKEQKTPVITGTPIKSSKQKLVSGADLKKADNLSAKKQNNVSYIDKSLMTINAVAGGIWKSLNSKAKVEKEEDQEESLPERVGASIASGGKSFLKFMGADTVTNVATRFLGNVAAGIGVLVFIKYIDEIMNIFKTIVNVVSTGAKIMWNILKFFGGPLFKIISIFNGKSDEDLKNAELIKKELDQDIVSDKPNVGTVEDLKDDGKETNASKVMDMGVSSFNEGGQPPVGEPVLVGESGPEMVIFDKLSTVLSSENTMSIMNSMTEMMSGNKERVESIISEAESLEIAPILKKSLSNIIQAKKDNIEIITSQMRGVENIEKTITTDALVKNLPIKELINKLSVITDKIEEIEVPVPQSSGGGSISIGGGENSMSMIIPIQIDTMGNILKQALYKE